MTRKYFIKLLFSTAFIILLILNMPESAYFIIFLLIHEFTHIIAGLKLGYRVSSIGVLPFGLSMSFKNSFINPHHENVILISGPMSNFVLSILFYYLFILGYSNTKELFEANLILGIFNMIPAGFLDGGNIFKNTLKIHANFYVAHIITNLNGIIFGCIIITIAFSKGFSLNNIALFLLGIFFILNCIISVRQTTIFVIKDVINKKDYKCDKVKLRTVYKIYEYQDNIYKIIKKISFGKNIKIHCIDKNGSICEVDEDEIINSYCLYGNITLKECIKYKSLRRN